MALKINPKRGSILSDYDIIDVAKKLKIKDLVFVGTQDMLNQVEKPRRKNKFYIINLDKMPQNGGLGVGNHWVMLSTHSGKGKRPFYGDSYGMPPPKRVHNFVSLLGFKELPFSDLQLQSVKSEICGWYALMYCDMLNQYYQNGKTFKEFADDFVNMGWNLDRQEKNNYKIAIKYFSNRL